MTCILGNTLMGRCRGPFVYSYVIQTLSWQLGFWLVSIVCGLAFVGAFFFVPEVRCLFTFPGSDDIAPSRQHIIAKQLPSILPRAITARTTAKRTESRRRCLPQPRPRSWTRGTLTMTLYVRSLLHSSCSSRCITGRFPMRAYGRSFSDHTRLSCRL